MIDLARERLAGYSHARALVADLHALPFDASSFDAVLMFHTLTYAEHPARALAECARVLRPRGRMALVDVGEPTSAPAGSGAPAAVSADADTLADTPFGEGPTRSVDSLVAP